MSDPLFQEAFARARSHFTEDGWLALSPREITEAIYSEIRCIDAERVAAQGPVDPGGGEAGGGKGGQVGSDSSAPKGAAAVRKPRGKVGTATSRGRPASSLG